MPIYVASASEITAGLVEVGNGQHTPAAALLQIVNGPGLAWQEPDGCWLEWLKRVRAPKPSMINGYRFLPANGASPTGPENG